LEAYLERGSYRRALELSLKAIAHHPQSGSLKIWRAVCLEAVGRTAEAVAILRPLVRSGDVEASKQSRYLLSIWEAPRLKRPQNWTVQIPDLSHLSDGDWNLTAIAPRKPTSSSQDPNPTEAATWSGSPLRRVGQGIAVTIAVVVLLWGMTRLGILP
jgi:hypothetical protein